MDIRRTTLVGATLILTALLAACATAGQDPTPTQSATLSGTEWVLISLNGSAPIEDTEITLNFEEASLDGSAGCNTYGGSYSVSEDSLRLSSVEWTEMGCPEPKGILDQEKAYFDALDAAARYRVEGDRLEVYDESGTQILVFIAATTASEEPTKSVTPEPQESVLTARIDVPTSLDSGETVKAVFTLTNISSDGFYVLKWFTPLEGLAGDIFRVERDGAELPYRGKLVKRGPPIAEDYVWLEAGESVSAEVDLAEGYEFSQAGQYTIQFRSPQISHVAKTETEKADSFEELGMIQIPSNTANVVIESSSGSQNTWPSAVLVDTEWVLTSLNSNVLIEGTRITLNFEEASLNGSAGCNTYRGNYTASEDSLRPTGVYWTEIGCMEPIGIMDQEKAYLDALNAAARYRVEGDRLEVYDEAGTQILVFIAATADALAAEPPTVGQPTAPTATPATGPPEGFKPYQDSVAGVAIYIPESWVVTGIVPGQYAILQSYPEDKYVGGEGRAPGDTKCDLNISPPGTSAADLIQQWKSNPDTAIIAEGEIALQSGQTGTVIEAENMGRSLSLISDVNGRAVALTCWGEFEPFDAIAVTLSSAGEVPGAQPAPDQPSAGSEPYQDQETGVSVLVPENWVVTGIVPGHKATLQSGDTQCDLLIRPAETSMAQLVQEMRTNTAITILSDVELTLASGEPGIKMEQESMVGRSLLLFTEVNERAVVLACYGDFAPFDEIALTIGASE
jgi:heat shock protein HslJ